MGSGVYISVRSKTENYNCIVNTPIHLVVTILILRLLKLWASRRHRDWDSEGFGAVIINVFYTLLMLILAET